VLNVHRHRDQPSLVSALGSPAACLIAARIRV
jgi:hypothetical protein